MDNVLIVDDEEDICYFLKRNLNKKNFSASFVNNLKDAEKALNAQQPSILLLDNHLPDGLGLDFAAKVKKEHPEIKIVMITAHDTQNDRSKANTNGIDYFLSKPFMMTEVYKAIDTVKAFS
jgi:two-component system, OmpR family, response regulator